MRHWLARFGERRRSTFGNASIATSARASLVDLDLAARGTTNRLSLRFRSRGNHTTLRRYQ
jgi:hypothetical protein